MLATTIDHEIERPVSTVFRRASIRRRQTVDGLYESSWFDITSYVKKWGTFNIGIDAVRFNRFVFSGVTLVVNNINGAFNPEGDASSIWNGYLTRYRTLLRIQAGYVQDDGTELPTDTTQGIFILDGEISIDATTMEATLNFKSLVSPFEEVRASELGGIYTTQTASDIFARIRDHTDGSSRFVFQQFISSGAWNINTTTLNYFLSASSAVADMSVWDLMNKLSEAEGKIVIITRTGGLQFRDRDPNTTTVAFAMKGLGSPRMNIIGLKSYYEPIDKFFNFYRLKYLDADTSSSFLTAGTITTIDPSNTSWKYGVRTYEFENTFFANTTTAQNAINSLFSLTSIMRSELQLDVAFTPHVEISDRVSVTYLSYDTTQGDIWGIGDWASDAATAYDDGANWDAEAGELFDFDAREFRILSKSTDLDNFVTEFALREI